MDVFAHQRPSVADIVNDPSQSDPPLSEVDLQAFVDGTLASPRAVRVDAYLRQRPREASRIAFYDWLNSQIRSAFPLTDPSLFQAPIRSMWGVGSRTVRPQRMMSARVFLVSIVALVGGSGWMAATQVSFEALNNAAVMVLAQVADASTDGTSAEPANPSLRDSIAPAPDLTAVGLKLVFQGSMKTGPFSEASKYVYRTSAGAPMVLLTAFSVNAPAHPQWIAHRVGQYRLLTWTTRHRRYVIAGAATTRGMMRAADVIAPK